MNTYNYNYHGYGKHTVEVTLLHGEFSGSAIYEIGGNTRGGNILESVLKGIEDYQPRMENEINKKHITVDENGYAYEFILFHKERQLIIDAYDIEESIVGVRIIKYEEE